MVCRIYLNQLKSNDFCWRNPRALNRNLLTKFRITTKYYINWTTKGQTLLVKLVIYFWNFIDLSVFNRKDSLKNYFIYITILPVGHTADAGSLCHQEVNLPGTNRVLLICKSRFGRFLRIDSAKSSFIDLLKKIDQIE